jgi:hypothetical protein
VAIWGAKMQFTVQFTVSFKRAPDLVKIDRDHDFSLFLFRLGDEGQPLVGVTDGVVVKTQFHVLVRLGFCILG